MIRTTLPFRNLRYHFRGNLAVLLGVAVSAAVLTGALLVGDSLRGSLNDRTERQLGKVDAVMVGGRFIRSELVEQLPGRARGAVLLQGAVYLRTPAGERRTGKVSVWGVDRRFGIDRPEFDGDEPVAILSANLAKSLNARVGSSISVVVQKNAAMPRSSFLSRRGVADTTQSIKLTVLAVLPADDPANSFSLSISPTLPINMFIPVARLQREIGQAGRVNAVLVSRQSAQSLQADLGNRLQLDDWGVKVHVPASRKGYVSVESTRLILEPAVVEAAQKTALEMGLDSAKTYVYLANAIAHGKQEIPYSIVAALDPAKKAPLGPFLPTGVDSLRKDEIVLADWKDSPIKIDPSEKEPRISLRYYKPEVEGRLEQASHTFTYRGSIAIEGAAIDRYLTPDFPGITDKTTLKSWDPPFEIDQSRIKRTDERYWEEYRTTPKAYIRLEDGQKLWGTRFGNVTSIRIAPKPGADLDQTCAEFAERLRGNLDPQAGGFIFQPIRERMLEAGRGSTDFGMLFLSFSFFLIIAALMLVGLLFRLNIERRASEIGLLRSCGFPLRTVRRLLLAEGLIIASIGAAVGLAGALLYGDAMVRLLVYLWPSGGIGSFLRLHVTPTSLAIGFGAAVLMSGVAILWALRILKRVPPAILLKGDASPPDAANARRRPWWRLGITVAALASAGGLVLLAPRLPPGEPRAGAFFGSGALLLTAGMAALGWWLKRPRRLPVAGHGLMALAKFGSRNAVRNPTRSLLTAGLLAAAAFLLVAVELFRRDPEKDFAEKNGGSGGFIFYAESSAPIDFDLDDEEGRAQIEDVIRVRLQELGLSAADRRLRLENSMNILNDVTVHRFRVQGGDDASCLNLYQASRPRLFGVPQSIIERGGFAFGDSLAKTPAEKENPWRLLNAGDAAIPCIVEQNTATWMLKKGLGDIIEVPDEDNHPLKLRIVALLKDSIFQSEILISDAAFRRHFSRTEGFSFFLIDSPADRADRVSNVLTRALANYGFEVGQTRQRVETYLAVQNTYLTTFQLLGAFGLLLGVLGLSVVLLRSVWERRAELALLRALGYRVRALSGIVLAENGMLLLLGLGIGVLAALAAVAPHLAETARVPWSRLVIMLGIVIGVGLSVAVLAVVTTLRAPLIPALRRE
jgi:ABC-type lipoprotein release transport system permease subunit